MMRMDLKCAAISKKKVSQMIFIDLNVRETV